MNTRELAQAADVPVWTMRRILHTLKASQPSAVSRLGNQGRWLYADPAAVVPVLRKKGFEVGANLLERHVG